MVERSPNKFGFTLQQIEQNGSVSKNGKSCRKDKNHIRDITDITHNYRCY